MITVGITGHRFLAETRKVTRALDQVLEIIETRCPDPEWTVISSLAEGSDQLFVERVLKRRSARLIVPLPMPEQDLLRNFSSAKARSAFRRLLRQAGEVLLMPPSETHGQAYRKAGMYVVEHSAVMVAVWDGLPAQGVGGTGDVVAQVRERRMPLAWIYAGNRLPGTGLPTSLKERQGNICFENFPGQPSSLTP